MMRVDCNGCSPISWRLTSSHVPFFVASFPPSSWWKRTPCLYQNLQFPFSCLKYPSHVWRRVPSSTGVLGIVCVIVSLCPILVFPSFTVCASFPYGTTAYDCYSGSSCNGCVWFCGKALHSPPVSIPTIWGSDGLSIGCKCWSIPPELHAILRMSFQ